MSGLVEICGEFSKVSKKQQITASSSNLESSSTSCGIVSTTQQREGEEIKGKKMTRSLTLTESEATICMLLMDRFAPS